MTCRYASPVEGSAGQLGDNSSLTHSNGTQDASHSLFSHPAVLATEGGTVSGGTGSTSCCVVIEDFFQPPGSGHRGETGSDDDTAWLSSSEEDEMAMPILPRVGFRAYRGQGSGFELI